MSDQTYLDTDVFARINSGKIVEYPVLGLYIRNRAHPVEWYTPVNKSTEPTVDEVHYYTETLTINNDRDGNPISVDVSYDVKSFTLTQLFKKINSPAIIELNIPPSALLFKTVIELVGEDITSKLNQLCVDNGYFSLDSCLGYINSKNTTWKYHANYISGLRDDLWSVLYAFADSVKAGTTPFPKSYDEVLALLPPIVWQEPPAA